MKPKEYPFYLKSTVILFGLILLTYALYTLKEIFAPLAFSLIISILLNPLVNLLQKKKVPRVLAIGICMLMAIVFVASIFYFLSSQIARFGESFPVLQTKILQLLGDLRIWIRETFGFTLNDPKILVEQATKKAASAIGTSLGSTLGTLGLVLLVPVYVLLLLFYKSHIRTFLYEVFANEHSEKVGDVLTQTKMAIQSYMVGLLIEMLIVAIMNSTALLLLDIKYAILLGVIGAILNTIPYLGGIIAIALPVLIATITKDGFSTQLGVIGAYALIQFIDNNILVPRIVSSKVQINALFSIVVVLLGGALWGIAGMFLSIPMVAIIKIVFDRVPELKPWGKLLGDEVPTGYKNPFKKKHKSSIAEKMVEKSS